MSKEFDSLKIDVASNTKRLDVIDGRIKRIFMLAISAICVSCALLLLVTFILMHSRTNYEIMSEKFDISIELNRQVLHNHIETSDRLDNIEYEIKKLQDEN